MKENVQKFGKSLLLPISTIAAAGIFMGIAAALQNSSIVGSDFVAMEGAQLFIGFIRKLAGLVFGNLPLFFALSVTVGLAKEEKETAAFSAILGFIVFHFALNYILTARGLTLESTSIETLTAGGKSLVDATIENARYESVLGFFTLRMNVFAGIIVGLLVGWLHNHFYQIKLPSALNFFGGKRFIPLITLIAVPVVAIISYFIWPFFDQFISLIGLSISKTGVLGPFIYGTVNRLLIPTGLHHILNQLVRFTPIGGTAIVGGETISGALNIFNAAVANLDTPNSVFQMGARFIGQGHTLISVFGLPAAAWAMIQTTKPEHKKRVKTMLLAALSAALLTGITEPIEFAFMFISPVLFVFHALMTGIGYMLLTILGTSVGGVQAGLIDFTIFGILRGWESKWYLVVLTGVVVAATYYFGFKFLIERFNIKTPGREEDTEEESQTMGPIDSEDLVKLIVEGLGGIDNIVAVTNCMTRLRVEVKNNKIVDEKALKQTGASGFVKPTPTNIQIVYGLQVDQIATNVKKYLKTV